MTTPRDPHDDPFEALRFRSAPIAPRPDFVDELRRLLDDALRPEPRPSPSTTATDREVPAMSDTTTNSPTSSPSLSPYLSVAGAAEAMDWYRDVFGAIETMRFVGDDGRVGHGQMVIGGSSIMLSDPFPEMSLYGPDHYGGTTVTLALDVVDVDHTYGRAIEGGATSEREPTDQSHGHRNGVVIDPFGHRWILSETTEADAGAASADGGDDAAAVAPGGFTETGRRPAEPGYIVMTTGDLDQARTFFGALFGWEIQAGNVEGGGHIANTHFPMGFMTGTVDTTVAPATVVHFRVDDIEVYADRVADLGGQVLSRDEYPSGGNASCLDDQGYRFDLFRPAPGY